MRIVTARPSPHIRRRVALAAARNEEPATTLARRYVETWLRREESASPPAVPTSATFPVVRYSVSDTAHRKLRILAAAHDVSLSEIVVGILDACAPHEIELLTEIITEGK